MKQKDFLEKSLLRQISKPRSNYASSSVDNKSQGQSSSKPLFNVNREFSLTHLENNRKNPKSSLGQYNFLNHNLLGTGYPLFPLALQRLTKEKISNCLKSNRRATSTRRSSN